MSFPTCTFNDNIRVMDNFPYIFSFIKLIWVPSVFVTRHADLCIWNSDYAENRSAQKSLTNLTLSDYQILDEAICTSRECVESAMMLLQTVNFSQNPCDDFYNFACGRFGEEHPIDDKYTHNSWFLEKELRLNRLVQNVLEEPVKTSDLECVKRTKQFYQSCINSSKLPDLVKIKHYYLRITLLRSWAEPAGTWTALRVIGIGRTATINTY